MGKREREKKERKKERWKSTLELIFKRTCRKMRCDRKKEELKKERRTEESRELNRKNEKDNGTNEREIEVKYFQRIKMKEREKTFKLILKVACRPNYFPLNETNKQREKVLKMRNEKIKSERKEIETRMRSLEKSTED